MSYLQRMLLRARAEPRSAATPRLPSWFEEAPEAPAEESMAPTEPRAQQPLLGGEAQSDPTAAGVPPRPTEPTGPPPGRPLTTASGPPVAARAAASDPVPGAAPQPDEPMPTAPAAPADVEPAPPPRPSAAIRADTRISDTSATDPPSPGLVAAVPDPPAPPVPAVPRSTDGPPATERGDTARAPDVVHVAIGRIEVRATIAQPPPAVSPQSAQGPRQPSRPVLSLADYLAGKREAR